MLPEARGLPLLSFSLSLYLVYARARSRVHLSLSLFELSVLMALRVCKR